MYIAALCPAVAFSSLFVRTVLAGMDANCADGSSLIFAYPG